MHPRAVLLTWLLLTFVGVVIVTGPHSDVVNRGYTVPGSGSAHVEEILRREIVHHAETSIFAMITSQRLEVFPQNHDIIGRLRELSGVASAEILGSVRPKHTRGQQPETLSVVV